jgi:hypothetical protein
MSDLFWLSEAQVERLRSFFRKSRGKPQGNDRRATIEPITKAILRTGFATIGSISRPTFNHRYLSGVTIPRVSGIDSRRSVILSPTYGTGQLAQRLDPDQRSALKCQQVDRLCVVTAYPRNLGELGP